MFSALIRCSCLVFCFGLMGLHAPAETLEDLIAEYEAFYQAGDPEERAKARDEAPRRWGDVTPDYIAARAGEAQALLTTLQGLDDTGDGPEAAILTHLLTSQIHAHDFDTARIPFVGDWGFFAEAPFTAMRTRANSREKADAWTARLEDLPRYFSEHIANMQRGIDTGWTQHGDPLATSIAQVREQIHEDPTDSTLFLPYASLDSSDLSADEIAALKARGETAVRAAIAAYARLLDFMETQYAPAARPAPGLLSLIHI